LRIRRDQVTHNDSTADYAPTQILAETFKSEGCAGIAYQSLLGKGKNIVLFDLDAAECVHIFLCKTDNISFNFRYVREDYQQMEPEVESE
jgi:hypothetical protein